MKKLILSTLIFTALLSAQNSNFIIISNPESSKVFINGRLQGYTPFTLNDSLSRVDLVVTKSGFIPFKKTILRTEFSNNSSTVQLEKAAVLTVNSIPESAAVFIDNINYGRTPITIDTLTPRTIALSVIKNYFETYNEQITLSDEKEVSIVPVLEPLQTSVTIKSNSPHSVYLLNKKPLQLNKDNIATINYGGYQLSAIDTITRQQTNHNFLISSKEHKAFDVTMNYFSYPKMSLGILLPGYNQLSDGEKDRATILGGLAVGSTIYFTSTLFIYLNKSDELLTIQRDYSEAQNTYFATLHRQALDQKHSEIKSVTTHMNIALFVATTTWLYNAYDVIMNHSIDSDIKENYGSFSINSISTNNLVLNYNISF